jgi:thiol-disulfide isomerase/thioredoxin
MHEIAISVNLLQIVLIILVIYLIVKIFIKTTYYPQLLKLLNINNTKIIKNQKNYDSTNNVSNEELQKIITETQRKINKVAEQSYVETFKNMYDNYSFGSNSSDSNLISNSNINNNNNNTYSKTSRLNSTGFLSKNNKIKLMLFYRPTCPYCRDFMPVWHQVINNLPSNVLYDEINVSNDTTIASQYNITGVPTIILDVNAEKKTYMGNRSYNDIKRFLKEHQVNLVDRSFESFDDQVSGDPITGDNGSPKILSGNCPPVYFNKKVDLMGDSYKFQIFNKDGQYGFAEGGYKSDKILTPFAAAYSTVDSYLSSLPDSTDPSKNSLANINECAKLYAKDIACFGLCEKEKLDEIKTYQKKIQNGNANTRIDGVDYSNNDQIVNAIKEACQMST